ncbi:MAG: hypothetical protein HY784_08745, partial [Chloroflexi bacterium]|nr:hypothetical protein [Chloroflexota bacterium]
RTFATASAAATLRSPAALRAALMLNRENSLRALDAALAELAALREAIAGAGDDSGPALDALLGEAAEKRERWRQDRQESNWQTAREPEIELPTAAQVLGQSVGLGEVLRRRELARRKK